MEDKKITSEEFFSLSADEKIARLEQSLANLRKEGKNYGNRGYEAVSTLLQFARNEKKHEILRCLNAEAAEHPFTPPSAHLFNLQEQIEKNGNLLNTVDVSPYEVAYNFQRITVVVWRQGPNKGCIYRIMPRTETDTISVQPFFDGIDRRLKELQDARQKNGHYTLPAERRQYELYRYMHSAFYGLEEGQTIGIEKAFMQNVIKEKDPRLMQAVYRFRHSGGFQWLRDRAKELGLQEISILEFQPDDEFGFFALQAKKLTKDISWHRVENNYVGDPLQLVHYTDSFAFSNILQMGGIAAKDFFEKHGIQKLFGGEGGGGGAYTPRSVSFWNLYLQQPLPLGIKGSHKEGMQYPIAFCIDEKHAKKLLKEYGTMNDELTVRDFVPLSCITHMFVPKFALQEVQELLRYHGWPHIKVLDVLQQRIPRKRKRWR